MTLLRLNVRSVTLLQVGAVAVGTTVLLLAVAARYGPHRDEMYFVRVGGTPAWGYVDQPPLTPLLAHAVDA